MQRGKDCSGAGGRCPRLGTAFPPSLLAPLSSPLLPALIWEKPETVPAFPSPETAASSFTVLACLEMGWLLSLPQPQRD